MKPGKTRAGTGGGQAAEPQPLLWTREEYYRMAEAGLFRSRRVELLEGEIVVLSPQKSQHYATADRIAEVLRAAFGPGYWVRIQGPVALGLRSEPEPDVS